MLETWLHLDHSFLRGLYNMLFRLGPTTREFNSGKRARHVPPFRFYLVVSLFCLFVIFPGHAELNKLRGKRTETWAAAGTQHTDESKTGFARTLDAAIAKKMQDPGSAMAALWQAIPKALLVSVPFFALITRVLYRRRGYVYIEHLILAFNLHSFVFLWSAVAIGWSRLTGLFAPSVVPWLIVAVALYAVWTYYRTLQQVFERSTRATLVLGTLAGAVYAFLLLNIMSIAALLTFLL